MTVACEDCGSGWPPMLLATVPLEGCPACRPEAWRGFGSGDERLQMAKDGSRQN